MEKFHFTDIPKYGRLSRDRLPDLCPHCNHKVSPEELAFSLSHNGYASRPIHLECAFQCTNLDCGHLFIATYSIQEIPKEEQPLGGDLSALVPAFKWNFSLNGTYPTYVNLSTFSEEIKNLSPNFIEIFNQSEEAQSRNLLQICGIGYRKALEFLIKDYCITLHPDKEIDIKSKLLSKCINDYINDANIKIVAERAAWLGNDEAHYIKKWASKDIGDLKTLIKLSLNWIESSILTNKYQQSMTR
ncbi:DUF4145 domain-containing protein [Comamonas thiooxydans]|uniref:DUF4145 domain-containing protein n=1 Tax=Comamonas thiooxydans TaxID=363952 RepID=UPI0015A749E9|nr:DUF4145 domain-containing protein [Comamonas thiooxydans]